VGLLDGSRLGCPVGRKKGARDGMNDEVLEGEPCDPTPAAAETLEFFRPESATPVPIAASAKVSAAPTITSVRRDSIEAESLLEGILFWAEILALRLNWILWELCL